MKITKVETYFCKTKRRNWVFVEVFTDKGISGLGEVSTPGLAKTCAAAVHDYSRMLIGQNPLEIERLFENMYRKMFWRNGPILSTAISGLEIALWDIKGKAYGLPVYALLGGPTRDKVKAYSNYWFSGARTVDDYARAAERAVRNGYTALKFSPWGPMIYSMSAEELEVARVCVGKVRAAIGKNVDMMIEAHGRFTLAMARRAARAIEEYDPYFIEEALPPENVDAMVELRRSINVPLATGERLISKYQYRELLSKYAVDYIQPDTIHVGGISETRKIAAMAETYYTPVIPHNPGGPVSTAAMIHLAASITNFEVLEYHEVADRQVLKEPLLMENGHFLLTDKPGLGIELDMDEIAKYPYEPHDNDHYAESRRITLS